MILSLRKRHRQMFTALGVLLPVAFVLGIAARKATPSVEALPPELLPQTQTFSATDHEFNNLFAKSGVKVRLWEDLNTRQLAVGLVPSKDFIKPDLIVYWVTGQTEISDSVPANATLLGSFVSTVLPLPGEAAKNAGVLVLFSLADQEIVDVSKPFIAERGSPTRSANALAAAIEQSDGFLQSPSLRLTEPRSGH